MASLRAPATLALVAVSASFETSHAAILPPPPPPSHNASATSSLRRVQLRGCPGPAWNLFREYVRCALAGTSVVIAEDGRTDGCTVPQRLHAASRPLIHSTCRLPSCLHLVFAHHPFVWRRRPGASQPWELYYGTWARLAPTADARFFRAEDVMGAMQRARAPGAAIRCGAARRPRAATLPDAPPFPLLAPTSFATRRVAPCPPSRRAAPPVRDTIAWQFWNYSCDDGNVVKTAPWHAPPTAPHPPDPPYRGGALVR